MGSYLTIENLDQIDLYLKNKLTNSERLEFEKLIVENPELQKEMIIQKQLFEINGLSTVDLPLNKANENDVLHYKEQLKSKDIIDLSSKIRKIGHDYINENSTAKQNFYKYYIAASIVIVFGAFLLFNSNSDLENYYTDNVNWQDLPSFIDKGQPENDFTKGEVLFKNEEYDKAIKSFEKISPTNELYPYSLMYIGASYDRINENEKAITAFNQLSNLKSSKESSKGNWYKFLLYLKQNNKEKALEMKSIILKDKNNFNYKKASDIEL